MTKPKGHLNPPATLLRLVEVANEPSCGIEMDVNAINRMPKTAANIRALCKEADISPVTQDKEYQKIWSVTLWAIKRFPSEENTNEYLYIAET